MAVSGPMHTGDLFDGVLPVAAVPESLADGAVLLRGCAREVAPCLVAALADVLARAPLRNLVTPGGRQMSVAMTNCGHLGWIADRHGYRYVPTDPVTGKPWPPMPAVCLRTATDAARLGGWPGFLPDVCLVNRYVPGTRLSLHQDRDEADFCWPIVSISLGLPAIFLFGGRNRRDPVVRARLAHGDVVAWGGPARLYFHGVAPLAAGSHPLLGQQRINLTFRRAAGA